jgi:tetratricopeptide (TPR) repeat protein
LQLTPLAFLAMGFIVRRRRSGPPTRIRSEWQQRLTAARVQGAAGLTAGEQLLRAALGHFAPGRTVHSGSPAALASALQVALPADLLNRVTRLLEQLEGLRYAPGGATLDQARALFDELDRVLDLLWRELRDRVPAAPALPALLLILQISAPFGAGEEAFQSKRYADAISAFTQHVQERPDDAAGWYNLGAAYQANRQPAHSAWALLHALELEPRSQPTRTHLGRLGVGELAKRVRPFTTLSTNELFFACSAFWWFAAVFLGYALARRRRWAAIAGGGLIALSALLLLAWKVERLLPPPAVVLDEGATLLAGRSLHSDAIRQLQPLAGVTVLEQSDEWLRVRTTDGEEGWVSGELLGRLDNGDK